MLMFKQGRLILAGAFVAAFTIIVMVSLKAEEIINKETDVRKESQVKVCILTADAIEDQSWSSLAYKGMLQIEDQFPVEAELVSEIRSEVQMREIIDQAVQRGVKVIIGHGREYARPFDEAAADYPDVQFAHLNGEAKRNNHTAYTYNQNSIEIERIAALAVSMKTKTNKIGLIDPVEDRLFHPGFEKGLKQFAPEAEFYYKVVGDWEDGTKAVQIAKEMIDGGVDVLYSRGNEFNRAVINYALKQGVYVIGYMDNQSYIGEEVVLTSIVNDIPQVYEAIMNDYFSKEGMPGGIAMLTNEEGVYSLAPLGPMYTEKEKQRIQAEIDKLN
ncbi:BMP family ABC transporter substrate-binding protein [Domibacillus iocasae]|uniref:BMP family ABC transporter substrate-binding protein n=1 Tax=Domibacillus iocasae TaxID=1714016 RepID=A0A1E7DLD6_9BACI|nr:BMP family ABC transporter substrate-binding protein [Domibacillus iocasae]OES43863.1 BMP family ABC transporter substrate-binding protein [Domibacillus iocasae]